MQYLFYIYTEPFVQFSSSLIEHNTTSTNNFKPGNNLAEVGRMCNYILQNKVDINQLYLHLFLYWSGRVKWIIITSVNYVSGKSTVPWCIVVYTPFPVKFSIAKLTSACKLHKIKELPQTSLYLKMTLTKEKPQRENGEIVAVFALIFVF